MKRIATGTAAALLALLLGAGVATAADEGKTAAPGLHVPDSTVTDQEGRPVHFYSDLVRGKVVAINFVFTTCTTICPPLGANFARLQKLLGERAGRDVHLISVSVDPGNDTPARLKAWAQKFSHGDLGQGWTLVTGERGQVSTLLKALGAYTPDPASHSPLLLLGNDRTGRWTRAYGLAPPTQIAKLIEEMEGRP
jgi:protein SCO1/2